MRSQIKLNLKNKFVITPYRANWLLKLLGVNCKIIESLFRFIRNFKIEVFAIETKGRNWNFYPTAKLKNYHKPCATNDENQIMSFREDDCKFL